MKDECHFKEMKEQALLYRDAKKPFDIDSAIRCIEDGRAQSTSFPPGEEISEVKIWARVEDCDLLALSAVFFGMDHEILDDLLKEKNK